MSKLPNFKSFRLAIVLNQSDVIQDYGTITWIEDVLTTNLTDLSKPSLLPTIMLLVEIANTLDRFASNHLSTASGLELATFNKLESLGWKTYLQVVRKAYRKDGSLFKKHVKIEVQ